MNATNGRNAAWTDRQLAHGTLRLVLGSNIATHGLSRVAHPGTFADALVREFSTTILPEWTVRPFAMSVPFAELAIGLAVLFGVRLRIVLVLGALLIAALTFGSCLHQDWESAGLQLIYALIYFVLLAFRSDARACLVPDPPVRQGGEI